MPSLENRRQAILEEAPLSVVVAAFGIRGIPVPGRAASITPQAESALPYPSFSSRYRVRPCGRGVSSLTA